MRYGSLSLQKITSRIRPSLRLPSPQLVRYVNRRHVSTRLSEHNGASHRASGTRAAKAGIGKRYLTLGNDDDWTIYALSTAPGRSAIAIIRLSGPACLEV